MDVVHANVPVLPGGIQMFAVGGVQQLQDRAPVLLVFVGHFGRWHLKNSDTTTVKPAGQNMRGGTTDPILAILAAILGGLKGQTSGLLGGGIKFVQLLQGVQRPDSNGTVPGNRGEIIAGHTRVHRQRIDGVGVASEKVVVGVGLKATPVP
jgi:hypothetical protein